MKRNCYETGLQIIAIATTEADEAIASSVFVQIMGKPLQKPAGWGHFGYFWSLTSPRLILRSGYGDANKCTSIITQRLQKLTCLRLSTECFMKISLHS